MIELTDEKLTIHVKTYLRTARIIDFITRFSKINIRLHETNDIIEKGNIFLFNHFSRFETFIPQYLFLKKSKVFCRSVASADFFDEGMLSHYLLSIGAIPHTYPNIFNFLTREINRGIKIILFPEGAMIKDKSVIDKSGMFSVYSREKRAKRHPHTGAAVIALRVESYRFLYRLALKSKDKEKIDFYSDCFSPDEKTKNLADYTRPTQIVPATITFYPLRISKNFLNTLAERIDRKNRRLAEEMAIEGNFVTKDTDMDIHLSAPINVHSFFTFIDKAILSVLYRLKVELNPDLIQSPSFLIKLFSKLYEGRIRLLAIRITSKCMKEIYSHVTVNISHIASWLIFFNIMEKKIFRLEKRLYFTLLYCVIKEIQKEKNIILHPHLKDPEHYGSLLGGENDPLNQFLLMAKDEGLLTITEDTLFFLPKLLEKYEFDTIRIENTPRVLYNEAQLIKPLRKIVKKVVNDFTPIEIIGNKSKCALNFKSCFKQFLSLTGVSKYKKNHLPDYLFEDDIIMYRKDKEKFTGSDYEEINKRETKTLGGEPFFLKSRKIKWRKTGVLLIHGFSASPAEMKPLGNFLNNKGFTVYGVRLKGHGTSPYDLDQTTWKKCIESIEQGYKVLSMQCEKIVVIGFSIGAIIALDLASQLRDNISSAVSISAPIEVEGMSSISLILSAQMEKLIRLIPGVKTKFIEWETESPETNYRSVPLQKLVDLKNYIEQVKERLKMISTPILVIQATRDPFVKYQSAEFVYESVSPKVKEIYWHESDKHNIVNKNSVAVYNNILAFIEKL